MKTKEELIKAATKFVKPLGGGKTSQITSEVWEIIKEMRVLKLPWPAIYQAFKEDGRVSYKNWITFYNACKVKADE